MKREYLTISEAAKRLKVSRQAVHEAISKGLLKAKKARVVSFVWLVEVSELGRYKASPRSKAQRKRKTQT